MDYQFNPPNVMVDGYTDCRFTIRKDGKTYYSFWVSGGQIPADSGWSVEGLTEGEDYEVNTVITSADRVNLEYSSPLVEGFFPDNGYFISQTVTIGEEDSDTVTLNKMFKPVYCTQIDLYAEQLGVLFKCCIILIYDEQSYATLISFSSGQSLNSSSEVTRHEFNPIQNIKYGFNFAPHELQVNGSELYQDFRDYEVVGRSNYLVNSYRSIPEFINFSMSRNYSKFFLGMGVRD